MHNVLKEIERVEMEDITTKLIALRNGDRSVEKTLAELVYTELRRIARIKLCRERPNHTFESAALVNETYMRLISQNKIDWHSRVHFFAMAATIMRHILVDYAREHNSEKRGGNITKIPIDNAIEMVFSKGQVSVDLVALDEALKELSLKNPEQSQIVDLKFFGGLTLEEIAEFIAVAPNKPLSPSSIKNKLDNAIAWLKDQMEGED